MDDDLLRGTACSAGGGDEFGLLVVLGIGATSSSATAEETGPSAWCFRPALIWHPVAAEAYIPVISCTVRELPADDGLWSSEMTAELAVAPDDWTLPTRSISTTRWGWTHEYDAATGGTYVFGEMQRKQGASPTTATEPDVYLSVICDVSGSLHLSLASDVAPLEGSHSVVWWTDRSEYRRAETWDAEELTDGSAYFRAWAPAPNELWAEIRDSSRLYVIVFGERSWRMAEAFVTRINQLDIVDMLDYCGQDERPEPAAEG